MDRLGQIGLAVEQRGAVEGREEPLVGIDDERVGPFEPDELVPDRWREQGGAPVGAVDVEPQRAFRRHIGHAGEVVDDAGVGRSCRGDHGDHVVGPRVPFQGGPQRQARQPVVVGRDDQGLDADDVEGLAHRGVGVLTHRHQRVGGSDPAPPVAGRVAGHHERREVPGRASRDEASPGPGGQAGRPGQDLERLVLGDDGAGRLQPRRPVQRGAGDEHVEEQGCLGRGGRDEGQKAGAVARHHRRGQLVDEQPHDLGGLVPLGAHQTGQDRDQIRGLTAEVQRDRVECQTLLAVGHHQVGHGLVVVEHPR